MYPTTRPETVAAAAVAADASHDAYRTSGTSPGVRSDRRHRTGTLHLLGPGAVGRALLARIAGSRRFLIAVTDSTATVHEPAGIDPAAIACWKAAGRPLRDWPGARALAPQCALALADADVIIDASSSEPGRPGWTAALSESLDRGACLALAAKAALGEVAAEWLGDGGAARVGCNAVLGGTGLQFVRELPELRQRWCSVAIVGNASTTTILGVVEQGGTLQQGIDAAAQLGFLEPDPELDLRGADAAVKLAIVASVLTARRILPNDVTCEDIRAIDLSAVRARSSRGCTTRLVARLTSDGRARVAYEEIPLDSVLATRPGHVVYDYQLTRNERRLHIGGGIGPDATAAALWADVQALSAATAAPAAHVVAGGAR